MNTYFLDSNRTAQPSNTVKMKVYDEVPNDLTDINDNEVIAVKELPRSWLKANVGMVQFFQTAPSDNWLLLDGSTFDADEYPQLYELLGTNELPNAIGRYLKGGEEPFVTGEASLPKITGTIGHASGYTASSYVEAGFVLTENVREAGWLGQGGNYGGVATSYMRFQLNNGNEGVTAGTVLATNADVPPNAVHVDMLPYVRAR